MVSTMSRAVCGSRKIERPARQAEGHRAKSELGAQGDGAASDDGGAFERDIEDSALLDLPAMPGAAGGDVQAEIADQHRLAAAWLAVPDRGLAQAEQVVHAPRLAARRAHVDELDDRQEAAARAGVTLRFAWLWTAGIEGEAQAFGTALAQDVVGVGLFRHGRALRSTRLTSAKQRRASRRRASSRAWCWPSGSASARTETVSV